MTLADFAAAAHLSCLDYISDVDWNRSEIVKDWYAKIKSRPAFRSILADQVPGFLPPPHYADLDSDGEGAGGFAPRRSAPPPQEIWGHKMKT